MSSKEKIRIDAYQIAVNNSTNKANLVHNAAIQAKTTSKDKTLSVVFAIIYSYINP